MKDLNEATVSPFTTKVSFNKYLEHYDQLAKSTNTFTSNKAKKIIERQANFPILREGFSEISLLEKYEEEINFILQDTFSDVLTYNEIKTASIPFHNIIFNSSKRFQKIIETAGDHFNLEIFNIPIDDKYIFDCTLILKFCYEYELDIRRPFFYKIPDIHGIIRYYSILYNLDFIEIIPQKNAPTVTPQDIDELIDNYENIALWKSKFPENSYLFKGFVISNIYDSTNDHAISNIKSNLIGKDKSAENSFALQLQEIFQSLFNIKELEVGFSVYNKEDHTFERVYGQNMNSFLLDNKEQQDCATSLCKSSYQLIIEENKHVAISDILKKYNPSDTHRPHIKTLYNQNIRSTILAPVSNDKELLGVLELVSKKPKILNSINANKLKDIMPHIVAAVERTKEEEENLIEAIIQKECTSIHPSVHWKFKHAAEQYIKEQGKGNHVSFSKIIFNDVYPLYGQIDIKSSSEARNWATQQDLSTQLNSAKTILEKAIKIEGLPIYYQYLFQINEFIEQVTYNFQVDSEQKTSSFLKNEIGKLFEHTLSYEVLIQDITEYFSSINTVLNVVYKHRKDYDDTVTLVNKKMAALLDSKQVAAQNMYPHFFERFKTDGIEHSMYIGEAITKKNSFNLIYLYNLRLWQLQVMCEMENKFYQMQSDFPVKLDVASMILVFNTPLSIRFRMDEKKFDVDGTYNARYEVVKKRVDKAFIKGTKERITNKGKITIVYSQKQDENEYLKYIKFLQSKHYLDDDIEILELEDLQAVTGLKAIRVSILYTNEHSNKSFYSYEDLMKVLNN